MEKIVDTRQGLGTIHKGDKKLGTVKYRLQVLQDYIDISSKTGAGEIPGWKRVVGHMDPQDIHILTLFEAGDLALQLEDGDWIKLIVRDTNGAVVANGDFYRKP